VAMTEADIRRFIPEPQPQMETLSPGLQEVWDKSVERYDAREAEALAAARYEYHAGQAVRLRRTLGVLVKYHETEAKKYRTEGES
jgi:hypothetical protein